jgi:hypothetical protein
MSFLMVCMVFFGRIGLESLGCEHVPDLLWQSGWRVLALVSAFWSAHPARAACTVNVIVCCGICTPEEPGLSSGWSQLARIQETPNRRERARTRAQLMHAGTWPASQNSAGGVCAA